MNLDQKELEKEKHIFDKLKDKSLENIETKDLYDDYQFKDVYGLHTSSIEIDKYFFSYDQVIIKVAPQDTKANFEKNYQIKFEDFLRLVDENKILPLICYPYENYNKFFGDLFKLSSTENFPRTGRVRNFLEFRNNISGEELFESIKTNVNNKAQIEEVRQKYFSSYSSQDDKIVFESFYSDLFDLVLLDMQDTVDKLLKIAKYDFSRGLALYLARPFFESLGGINSFSNKDLKSASELYLKTKEFTNYFSNKKYNGLSNSIEAFMGVNPLFFSKLFEGSVELSLYNAQSADKYKYINEISSNNEVKEFRKYLKGINHKNFNETNMQEVRLIAKEINNYLERDARRLKLINKQAKIVIKYGKIANENLIKNATRGFDFGLSTLFSATADGAKEYYSKDELSEILADLETKKIGSKLFKPIATSYWEIQN